MLTYADVSRYVKWLAGVLVVTYVAPTVPAILPGSSRPHTLVA
jgi:hypothetical protein